MKLKALMDEVTSAVASASKACDMLREDMEKRLASDMERSKIARENAEATIAGFRAAVLMQLTDAEKHIAAHFLANDRALLETAAMYTSALERVVATLDKVRAEHLDGGHEPPTEPRPKVDVTAMIQHDADIQNEVEKIDAAADDLKAAA